MENANDKIRQGSNPVSLNIANQLLIPIISVIDMGNELMNLNPDEKQTCYISDLKNTGEIMYRMTKDIIDTAKRFGSITFTESRYCMKELLRDLYCILLTQIKYKNLTLILEINPEIPTEVVGDRLHIFQILLNIAGNAVKFTQNGRITIKVDWNGNKENTIISYEIKDTGIGIESHHLARIFESKLTGGLGLSVSKTILEKLGGEISAESEYGLGSTFTIKIRQKVEEYSPIGENASEDIIKNSYVKFIDPEIIVQSSEKTSNIPIQNLTKPRQDKKIKEPPKHIVKKEPEKNPDEQTKQNNDKNTDNNDSNVTNNINSNKSEEYTAYIPKISDKDLECDKGMQYFTNNEEYVSVLEAVYEDGYDRIAYMKKYMTNGDIDKYINELHSIKTIAENIGAVSFSIMISASITAHKNNDITYVKNNFNIIIKKYESVLSEINNTITKKFGSDRNKNKKDYSAEYNNTGATLMKISDYIDNFNSIEAESEIIKMLELENVDWIKKQVLKRTLKLLSDSCYQDVKNIVIAMARGEKL